MPDFNLTKTAQGVEGSLALIDEGNDKLVDSVVAAVGVPLNAAALLANTQLTPTIGQDLYHTGNTGTLTFGSAIPISELGIRMRDGLALTTYSQSTTTNVSSLEFQNPTGLVGAVRTSGSTTTYSTSSDPRLKDFLTEPSDAEIDDYFGRILDSAAVFTWKSDSEKVKTWGFNAHKAEDNNLHMACHGEGPRNLAIGEVYESAVLDEDGNEIEPAKKVSSSGVDQSKDIAGLVYKIAQLERRIKQLEGL